MNEISWYQPKVEKYSNSETVSKKTAKKPS